MVNKDWLIHYGDSGEPDESLFETEAPNELGALLNFAKDFGVSIPTGMTSMAGIDSILSRHGFIMGDIEDDSPVQ